jgi:hypothetical protein
MGMFDYVRSSYPLGPTFTNVELQTKDIEDDFGGTMSNYWISPNGELFLISTLATRDYTLLQKGDEGYSSEFRWKNFQAKPNGNKGRVMSWYLTKYIIVYPSDWSGESTRWPECRIHFKEGKVQSYSIFSPGEQHA